MHRVLPLLLLALLASAPMAGAATLRDFEEPVKGSDSVHPVTITEEEAARPNIVVFLNAPSRPFTLIVYDAQGNTVWNRTGSLGVQTLPELPAGDYRFFIQRDGQFLVTSKILDRTQEGTVTHVDTALEGSVDAYVFVPTRGWTVELTGDVQVEVRELTKTPVQVSSPGNFTAQPPMPMVVTVRGEPGTPYTIQLVEREIEQTGGATGGNATPAPGLLLALSAVAAALVLRRR